MIEVKAKYFTQRLFATQIDCSDWYKSVLYNGYRGDVNKVPFWYFKHTDDHSCQSDLTPDIEVLFEKMDKSTRQDIRRAERDGIVVEKGYWYDEFIQFYNDFAQKKGIPNRVSMDRLLRYGKPLITKASLNGVVLAMHARIFDVNEKFGYALYSASGRFNEGVNPRDAGRANKYLQYNELIWFKEMGIELYDWSGVDINPQHTERHSIGEYKLAYGGEVVPSPTLYTPIYAFLLAGRTILSKFLNLLDLIKSSK